MRRMAERTAFSLDRRVLINEWSNRIHVAFGADRILGCTQAQQFGLKSAVWVMTVSALNQAFVNSVMERLHKCRLDVRVALITERWFFRLEQSCLGLRFVNAMAVGAADQGLAMRGSLKVRVITYVARETLLFHLPWRCFGKSEERGCIASAFNMCFGGAVTAFTGHSLTAMFERQLGMGVSDESLHLLLVAGCAYL